MTPTPGTQSRRLLTLVASVIAIVSLTAGTVSAPAQAAEPRESSRNRVTMVTATAAGTGAATAAALESLTATPTPIIVGTPVVGATLSVTAGTWLPAIVTLTYQWYRGSTRITGATAASYRLVASDLGELLSITVTGSKSGYTAVSQASAQTTAVAAATLTLTPTPSISGTPIVGQRVKALPGVWALAPVAFSYEWNRDDVPISGAPQLATYTLTNADAGATITVTVTGTKAGFETVSRTSAPTSTILRALGLTPAPTLSGAVKVASTLTASAGTWGPGDVALEYVWKRGATVITGAETSSYTLVAADLAKKITVTVIGSRTGYATMSRTSVASVAVAPALLTLSPLPTITGHAVVGDTLTAHSGTWAPSPVGLNYQWRRGTTAISGATAADYVVVAADKGLKISVKVTGSRPGYTSITRTSATTVAVLAGVLSSTPTPELSGSPVVGETLTVDSAAWEPATVTLRYVWKRDAAVIAGAGRSSYTLTGADLGAEISVIVTGSKAGYTSVTTSSEPTAPVAVADFADTASPTITGVASVGQTLVANPGVWAPAATTVTYRWKRDGVAISGAPNGARYLVSSGDVGTEITVTVTGSRSGYASLTFTSAPTEPILALLTATPRPTVTGVVVVGRTLTVASGSWLPSPVAVSYGWKRGTALIGGANEATYELTASDAGKTITAVVTGTKVGFTPVAMSSVATAIVARGVLTATPNPTISGTAQVGETLTAAAGTWAPSSLSFAYQWKRDTVPIAGATSSSYALSIADEGARITVTVTGAKDGYTSVATTSIATVAITGAAFTFSPVPTVAGTARIGQVLTATAGTWGPAPVALAYQWYRATAAIIGATSATYTLTPNDANKAMTVTVSGTKDGYAAITRTSVPTALVQASPLSATPIPSIEGTPVVGGTLTAAPGTWLPAVVTLSYQWKRAGAAIAGATTASYSIVPADVGAALSVTVTGSKTGYTSAATTSLETAEIPEGTLTATPTPTIAGATVVGGTLTATAGTWRPAPVTLSYQWNRGGLPIDGETEQSHVLGVDDVGEVLTVTVTGAKFGYATESRTSIATAVVSLASFTTTPTPSVSGTRAVGSTLTAASSAWSPLPDLLEYQWLRDGSAIDGETALTYLLVPDDAATVITVAVTASRDGFTTTTRVSAAGSAIPGQTYASTDVPVITGIVAVGETLTAEPGVWDPIPESFTYLWKRGTSVIAGETGDTYAVTGVDLGAQITVTVTAITTRYDSTSAVSAPTVAVVAGDLAFDPPPTITGDATVGSVLTADPGSWVPDTATFTYRWLRDDVAISPAQTLATYTVVSADEGHELTVVVTGRATGYTDLPVTTAPVTPLAPTPFTTAPVPAVTGNAVVGETLTVDAGTWDPVPDLLTYRWKRGGVALTPAATDTSYLLTAADAGAEITVTVTAVLATYATTENTSVATSAVLRVLTASPVPTISGTLAVGSLLTAVPGTWSPAPVALTYEWFANGLPIDAATSSTYRLVAADLDTVITVAVTGTKAGYLVVTQSSVDSVAVVAGTFTTTPTPTLSGEAVVGSTLTVNEGGWEPAPESFSYVWMRDSSEIVGEVSASYVLAVADVGAIITVTVTSSLAGYDATPASSAGTDPVLDVFTAGTVSVVGDPSVGTLLTVDLGTWEPADGVPSYQWFRGAEAITDEIAATYTIVDADPGTTISVTVTLRKTGYRSAEASASLVIPAL